MTLYGAVILLWVGSEATILISRSTPPSTWKQDRFSGQALLGGAVLAVWLGSMFARAVPAAAIWQARPLVFGLGVTLAVAGIALRWYAVLTLGRFFTTRVMTRPDQTVVQTGPFRFVRHPSYAGALLTVLGVLLCSINWLSLACFLVALPGFVYRIHVEEQALAAALGDAYRDYMRHTKRLVPFVV